MMVYMKVDKIAGVGAPPNPDWVLLEDCTFEFERNEAKQEDEQSGTARKPIKITKIADRASTQLVRWLEDADLRPVQIEFCLKPTEVGNDLYILSFDLKEAKLSSYNVTFTSPAVMETFLIEYKGVKIEYWEKKGNEEWKAPSAFEL